MTHSDTTWPYHSTPTHPYLAEILLDPADCAKFKRTFEDQAEVRLLGIDRSTAETWTIYAACASREIKDRLESNW